MAGTPVSGGHPAIEVKNLEHSYGDFKVVDGISFSVNEGEIFSFLGPNHAGKSTAINKEHCDQYPHHAPLPQEG
jgi:ABC-2 type transport system ATP-binding protein